MPHSHTKPGRKNGAATTTAHRIQNPDSNMGPVTGRVKPLKASSATQLMAQLSEADQHLNTQHTVNEAKLVQTATHALNMHNEGSGLRNGDLVYLKSKSVGKYIEVDGNSVRAQAQKRKDSQQLVIRSAHGVISSGHEIFLKAHTGKIIAFPPSHEEGPKATAQWHDYGSWQS